MSTLEPSSEPSTEKNKYLFTKTEVLNSVAHIKSPVVPTNGKINVFEVVGEGWMGQRGEFLVEEETVPTKAWKREGH